MPDSVKKRKYDYTLLTALFLLLLIGLVILYSTSAYNGEVKFHDSFYYLKKQVFATSLGIAGMFLMAQIDYRILRKFAVPAYLAAVLCLLQCFWWEMSIMGPKDGCLWALFLFSPLNLRK